MRKIYLISSSKKKKSCCGCGISCVILYLIKKNVRKQNEVPPNYSPTHPYRLLPGRDGARQG